MQNHLHAPEELAHQIKIAILAQATAAVTDEPDDFPGDKARQAAEKLTEHVARRLVDDRLAAFMVAYFTAKRMVDRPDVFTRDEADDAIDELDDIVAEMLAGLSREAGQMEERNHDE